MICEFQFIGCILGCDNLQTGITASENGLYSISVGYADTWKVYEESYIAGQSILLNKDYLNEQGVHNAIIQSPSGTQQKISFKRLLAV